MRKNGFRKVLFGIMSFLMFFVLIKESIYADTGEEPEPSVTLEIKNAPEDYYVAILYEPGAYYDTDTDLKVQGPVDDSVLEKYLKDFCRLSIKMFGEVQEKPRTFLESREIHKNEIVLLIDAEVKTNKKDDEE